ncbi:MAG TPA: hypothetical protein VK607_27360, partial [Kofleriaceae bacterium]|nr:hypothetical protein [Kofleriaceae bacterium]
MNRASAAVRVGLDSTRSRPAARQAWRNTLWRRARSLTAEAAFQAAAAVAALHPAARPARHGITVERDVVYG